MKRQKGITLIELMLVMSLLAILTGITVMVIDPQRQRDTAKDGVNRANMGKVCAAIETYYEGENQQYPDEGDAGPDYSPLQDSADNYEVASIYIQTWPEGFVYNTDGDDFTVYVAQAGTANYFKCSSRWNDVRECEDGTDLNDFDDCD